MKSIKIFFSNRSDHSFLLFVLSSIFLRLTGGVSTRQKIVSLHSQPAITCFFEQVMPAELELLIKGLTEAYLGFSQTSAMQFFAKIVNGF